MVGSKVARMISGRWTDYGTTPAENRTALAFFLDRATQARLLLDGRRLQDVRMRSYRADPVVVAAAAGDAAAVALLLRYGVDERAARAAIAYLRQSGADDRGRPCTAGARSCLDLLRRAVVSEYGCCGGGGSRRDSVVGGGGDDGGCGGVGGGGGDGGCGGGGGDGEGSDGADHVRDPPLLLHLARCAVRKTLHDNFCLPHGLRQLPVPRPLLSYLDLEC